MSTKIKITAVVFLLLSLCFVISITYTQDKVDVQAQNNEVVNDETTIEEGIIEGAEQDTDESTKLVQKPTLNYISAQIASDNTIKAINTDGGEETINIEQSSWQDIQWSPDGRIISVLRDDVDGIFNLYTFDTQTQEWLKVTSYETEGIGISSYIWATNNTLVFTQGEPGDIWIHRYNYKTGNEVIKVRPVNATIKDVTENGKNFLLFDSTTGNKNYKVEDLDGNYSWNLQYINSFITPNQISPMPVFLKDSLRVIYKYQRNELIFLPALTVIGSDTALLLNEDSGITPICGLSNRAVLGYVRNDDEVTNDFVSFSLSSTVNKESLFQVNVDNQILESQCYSEDFFILKLENPQDVAWYAFQNDQLNIIESFASSQDIAYNPVQFL